MVSTYGYTTLAAVEKHAKRDYSAIDSTLLADANVDDTISDAEVFINGYVGTIFTGTIPPDIALITKMIAKIMLDNFMIERAIGELSTVNGGVIVDILERYDIVQILEKYKNEYSTNTGIFISKHTHAGRVWSTATRHPYRW